METFPLECRTKMLLAWYGSRCRASSGPIGPFLSRGTNGVPLRIFGAISLSVTAQRDLEHEHTTSPERIGEPKERELGFRFSSAESKLLPKKYLDLSRKYYDWARDGDLHLAFKDFRSLKDMKDRYYHHLYRPLLQYCTWFHEPELGFALFNVMKSDNVRLTAIDYNNVIRLCALGGSRETCLPRAFQLMAEMEEKHLRRHICIHTSLMYVTFKHGKDVAEIDSLLDDIMQLMRVDKSEFDWKSLKALLHYFEESGRPIEDLCVRLKKIEQTGFLVDTEFYATLYMLLVFRTKGIQYSRLALQYYGKQRKVNVPISAVSYAPILKAAYRCCEFELGHRIYREFESMCSPPLIETMNAYMELCLADHQFARIYEIYECIKSHGLEPTTKTFDFILETCSRDMKWEKALEIEKDSEGLFKVPLGYRALFSLLICACRSRNHDEMTRLKGKIQNMDLYIPDGIRKLLGSAESRIHSNHFL
jgi:hypothetical protein